MTATFSPMRNQSTTALGRRDRFDAGGELLQHPGQLACTSAEGIRTDSHRERSGYIALGLDRHALATEIPTFSVENVSKFIANRQSTAYTAKRVPRGIGRSLAREKSLMAKVARHSPVKKASKATPAPIKPVKMALTKSALVNLIAEENEIPRKTAAGVYATLENLFLGSVHPRGVGEFVLPGLLKVSLRKVPARKAGTLIRNPSTGQMVEAAAKPASVRVKIRALSKLKTAASA